MLYLKSFRRTGKYFQPSGEDELSQGPNSSIGIQFLASAFDLLCCGSLQPGAPGWFLVIGFPFLLIFGIRELFGAEGRGRNSAIRITLGFVIFTTLYLTLVTTSISVDDYNRYRFKINAYYLLLLGLFLTQLKVRVLGK